MRRPSSVDLVRLFLWGATLAGFVGALPAADRPNILWIIAEDLGPDLHCYGVKAVRTPTLDRMAARGTMFRYAFTVCPVCSTSRSAFCTGMYATTIGSHQHRTPPSRKPRLPEGVRLVTDWLRDAGYFTANIRWKDGQRFGTGKTDWNFRVEGKPFDSDRWEDLPRNQPFYAQINFSQTHRPFTAPRYVRPEHVLLPPYYPDVPLCRQDWAAYLDEAVELDHLVAEVLRSLEKNGLAENTIIFFFGDNGRAHVRGKQWCYDSGLRVPLIVYIPDRWCDLALYRKGQVDKRLVEAIDITATTLALAGVRKPPKMQGRVLFGPWAEPEREYVFGTRDRCDMTSFRIRTVRDRHYRYIRNYTPDRPFFALNLYKERSYPMIIAIRELHRQGRLTPVQARLLDMTMPPEELYFLDEDPYETVNLVGSHDPRHREALNRLRAKLDEWIATTGDKGAEPEPPEVALDYLRQGLRRRSSPDFLRRIRALARQHLSSPEIGPEYREFLQKAIPIIEEELRAAETRQRPVRRRRRR